MHKKIWIFCLEPLDSRYTQQWYTNIPTQLSAAITQQAHCIEVVTVDGEQHSSKTTSGAFLDFVDTNYYKSTQLCKFIEYFKDGRVGVDDAILFTDIWNPAITQVAYLRDLMGQNWQLHAIAHAGAYDPSDILGYNMRKPWPWHAEASWFYACDYTYFGTEFHRQMFLKNLNIPAEYHVKAVRSGQPHEPIIAGLEARTSVPKEQRVIWPHRYNNDKQPEIAEDLSQVFDVLITQKMSLSKLEYYNAMASCQVIFSCSLHENLGISIMEAVLMGVIPVLPDRCCYSEMYESEFLYPAEWTANYQQYCAHREDLQQFIKHRLEFPEQYQQALARQQQRLKSEYLNASIMFNNVISQK